jgi:predicted permease
MFFQHFRHSLRTFRKNPGFVTITALTLAVGIGANTAVFSLLYAVILKSLTIPRAEQLFFLKRGNEKVEASNFSYPEFQDFQRSLPSQVQLAASTPLGIFYIIPESGQAETNYGQLVSGNYFSLLNISPFIGRFFGPADDSQGSSPAVVISFAYLQRRFGGDVSVLGKSLKINGTFFTIVGVTPRDFSGLTPGWQPAFWIPLSMQYPIQYAQNVRSVGGNDKEPFSYQQRVYWLQLIARIQDAKLLPTFTADLNVIFKQHFLLENSGQTERNPLGISLENGNRGYANLRNTFSQPLFVLMGMVVLLLLIACCNIGNLSLVRATKRSREIALRLSLGAKKSMIVQQVLAEGMLIAIFGGALGLLIAYVTMGLLSPIIGKLIAVRVEFSGNWPVFAFTASISLICGFLAALIPALRSTDVNLVDCLKASVGQNLSIGQRVAFPRSILKLFVVSEVALSIVLLVAAGLLVRTLTILSAIEPGYDQDRLVAAWIDPTLPGYTGSALTSLYDRLRDKLRSLPQAAAFSLSTCGLGSGCADSSLIFTQGTLRKDAGHVVQENWIDFDYFKTVGIALVTGRDFEETDTANSPKVAIVNETFVHHFFPDNLAVGKTFGYDVNNAREFQIVGVVKGARVNDIHYPVQPLIYYPLSQGNKPARLIFVRTNGNPDDIRTELRHAILDTDRQIPIIYAASVRELTTASLRQERVISLLASVFGGLALALACLGTYGVVAAAVNSRKTELGMRLALGASRTNVVGLVFRDIFRLVVIGALLGTGASFLVVKTLKSLLFGLNPYDLPTILVSCAVLFLVTGFATLVPAWRAGRIDPLETLRSA